MKNKKKPLKKRSSSWNNKGNTLLEEEANMERVNITYSVSIRYLDADTLMIDHTPGINVFISPSGQIPGTRPCVNWGIFQRLARGGKCGFQPPRSLLNDGSGLLCLNKE